jgi:hypothetical protein
MMASIKLSDYQGVIDNLQRGQTVGVNHIDCPAGEDTKHRLYITRPSSSAGAILGYCHNCDSAGALKDGGEEYRDFGQKLTLVGNKATPFDKPDNLIACGDRWPDDAVVWRINKGLDVEDCLHAGIKYDQTSHRIFLPIYNQVNKLGQFHNTYSTLLGYQLRQIDGTGPKYYTAQRDVNKPLYTRLTSRRAGPAALCFLVEDFVSGLAVADTDRLNYDVVVNYGVKVKIEVLSEVSGTKYNVVWLDNDNNHVRSQASTIARTWALISGVDTGVEKALDRDPKSYSKQEIAQIIDKWVKVDG